jgi:acyl dehydratase
VVEEDMAEAEQEEKVWTWDMMKPGIEGQPITVEITRESIANYARSVQCDNPIYFDDEAARAEGYESVVAAPTMMFMYAPYARWELFNSHGYLAPEQAKNPRSTPFAGVEITFQGVPVYPGDTITSVTSIDRTWESRSGNKFVTYKIVGYNQRSEKVCEYLYDTLWEYARGRKARQV